MAPMYPLALGPGTASGQVSKGVGSGWCWLGPCKAKGERGGPY